MAFGRFDRRARAIAFVAVSVLIFALMPATALAVPVPPANDDFANATAIPGDTTCTAGTTIAATAETNEPSSQTGTTVWYAWTPASTATIEIRINLKTLEDSYLYFYTGTTLLNLVQVASNDDAYGYGSGIQASVTGGTTYYIRVDTYAADEEGTFLLNIGSNCAAPANDDFADATALAGTASGSLGSQSNLVATTESDEPSDRTICTTQACDDLFSLGGGSVWYKWTAPGNGHTEFCVTDTRTWWEPIVAVYTGSQGSLTEEAWGQGSSSTDTVTSCASIEAVQSTEYFIGVGGDYGADHDGFTLAWGADLTAPSPVLGGPSQTNASTLDVTVTWDEDVTGFGTEDVDLNLGAANSITATVDSVTGSGDSYTIHVSLGGSGTGVVGVRVHSGVEDLAGNPTTENSGYHNTTVDYTNPSISGLSVVVKGPKLIPSFSYSDDQSIGSVECQIDALTPYPCGSGQGVLVAKGDHTFYVTVTDGVGNTDTDSIPFTIKSGKIKPV